MPRCVRRRDACGAEMRAAGRDPPYIARMREALPIVDLLPAILASLAAHPRLVIEAAPGAGKTTQVPPALLDTPWLGTQKVLMLEPRRLATRAAATFMAAQRGEAVGVTVGYRIRFENRVSAATRIEVVTEGILTRMLQDDPTLEGIGALLFDEFHERHLTADLGLALALDVQRSIRPDLRIVLMSATLDGERLAKWLEAPRLTSASRAYAVTTTHFPPARNEALAHTVRRACAQALAAHPGDLLVFLPGARAIADATRALDSLAGNEALPLRVLPLHGELPIERQAEALAPDPGGARRIVLATNVAESSVTLPGTRIVIDAGLAREPRFDPNSGFSRLATVNIAQDSATQRAGRAGRVSNGWCYRLWPASLRLAAQRTPEIEQVDLSSLALELAAWGSSELQFVTPPPPGALAAARDLLQTLGLLDAAGRITPTGRRALQIGTSPRIATMLASAPPGQERALACDVAALIEARDPLRERSDDFATRWRALSAARDPRGNVGGARGALMAIDRVAQQWRRRIGEKAAPPRDAPAHALGLQLARAFPDRIARAHPQDPRRFQLANGRSASLFEDSMLAGEPWLALAELEDAVGNAKIVRAASLAESDLRQHFGTHFSSEDRVEWHDARGALVAERVQRFGAIVLARTPLPKPDGAACATALGDAIARLGLDVLPWTDATRQWCERVKCAAGWFPEEPWPPVDEGTLLSSREAWLEPALAGKTRLDTLSAADLQDALENLLDHAQRRRLGAIAPTQLRVPSGMQRALVYSAGSPPVLACKLQELFGLADTPRIAEGRVPVTLHLLSPAGRPLQVTQDLRGFWERTYPEVRGEMLRRYPRHPWPQDPWTAAPTHRAKPRVR